MRTSNLDGMTGTLYTNYDAFLWDQCIKLPSIGSVVDSRNGECREVLHNHWIIANPHERFCTIAERKANPIALIAETLWVLSGRDDVDFIEPYTPRAREWSDDGVRWRAAYGPRLFGAYERMKVEQVQHAIHELDDNPLSRRVVINLHNPEVDMHTGFKDWPCNNLIYFTQRDGRLDISITSRSMDLIWGSMVNHFEWSVLQELVARCLGVNVGVMTYSVESLHLYKRHYDLARRIAETPYNFPPVLCRIPATTSSRITTSDYTAFMEQVHDATRGIELFSSGEWEKGNRSYDRVTDGLLKDWMDALKAFWSYKQHWGRGEIFATAGGIHGKDTYDRVAEYLERLLQKDAAAEGREKHIEPKLLHPVDAIMRKMQDLHDQKAKQYGASWKARGEAISLFGNLSRKIDRLSYMMPLATTTDTDMYETVIDIANYATLYLCYLEHVDDEGFNDILYQEAETARSIYNNSPDAQSRVLVRGVCEENCNTIYSIMWADSSNSSEKKKSLLKEILARCIAYLATLPETGVEEEALTRSMYSDKGERQ